MHQADRLRRLEARISQLERALDRAERRAKFQLVDPSKFVGGCHCVEGAITACSVCSHTATNWEADIGSNWLEAPELAGVHTLEHQSGCVWESDPVTVESSDYIWRLTVTALDDVTLELILDSGSGGLSLPTYELLYRYRWVCECQNDLVLTNYGDIEDPTNLTMVARLIPKEPEE